MAGTYTFDIDSYGGLAIITIGGFFSEEEVRQFREARDHAYSRLRTAPNEHVTLVDMRGMSIQTQQGVAAFAKVLGASRYQSRKLAFVVTASLARQQIERAAAGRGARLFTNLEEAREWLDVGEKVEGSRHSQAQLTDGKPGGQQGCIQTPYPTHCADASGVAASKSPSQHRTPHL